MLENTRKYEIERALWKATPDDVPGLADKLAGLAGQFARLRSEDSRRLDAIGEYAGAQECRATFLRRYFGEEDEEPCGLCDVCRGRPARPAGFFAPLALPRAPRRKPRPRRRGQSHPRSRRRRSRRAPRA